jgi:pimeloyl-ACP methyl ester carboxylesterase
MTDGRLPVAPGVELAYLDRGSGPAIVFVPGWTFAKEIFEKQIADLSRKYRVIAFDPRSQGASSFTLEGNDYATHAEDLAWLLEALEIKNPVLVGWSAGAHATWGYIKLKGAEAVAAHVCIDLSPKCLSVEKDDWVEGTLDEISAIHTVLLRDSRGFGDFVRMYTETTMIQRNLAPEELAWILGQPRKCQPLIAAQLFASCMFADSLQPAIAVAKTRPTLHVIAQHWADKAVPFLKRLLPESRYVVFGGHMMFWEYPEAFNRVLDEFIQQNVKQGVPLELT